LGSSEGRDSVISLVSIIADESWSVYIQSEFGMTGDQA
jgi:hypothetical protein